MVAKKLFDGLRALENKKERESMNQEELDKTKKQEILVKDESLLYV